MHMESALVVTSVATVAAATQAGTVKYSLNRVKKEISKNKSLLMAIAGALVFAAQMINFTIPGTGSSGHLVGGILLAILLGPHAAFLVLSTILLVQCLFFGDGGLLALGCNILNMAFISCYIVYPLVTKPIMKKLEGRRGILLGAITGNIIGLVLGAFFVTLETTLSGISQLPFSTFMANMIPIHIAIGFVEGIITSAIVLLVYSKSSNLISNILHGKSIEDINLLAIQKILGIGALITGGVFSLFASSFPDGLEWSIANVIGNQSIEAVDGVHLVFERIQNFFMILPDYGFKTLDSVLGTSVAGVTGCILSVVMILLIGKVISKFTYAKVN